MYRNFERIAGALGGALEHLEGGQRGEGALDGLREAAAALSGASRYLPELSELEDALNEALYTAEDAASQVADQLSSMDYDEREAERVENRLDEIRRLEKKYGASVEAVLQYYEEISKELESYRGTKRTPPPSKRRRAGPRPGCCRPRRRSARRARRRRAPLRRPCWFSWRTLECPRRASRWSLPPCPRDGKRCPPCTGPAGMTGCASCSAPTGGSRSSPCPRTASGGELSRIMLAFKTICAGEVGSMVFDEIDTGISGRMAQVVGEKMAAIGRERQVIASPIYPRSPRWGTAITSWRSFQTKTAPIRGCKRWTRRAAPGSWPA